MRSHRLLVLSVTAAACTSVYGNQYRTESALEPATVFDCVQAKVNALGYTVQDANRDAGLVRAKTAQPTGMKLDGTPFFDEVTVSITKDAGSGRTVLNVTATKRADADSLLAACRIRSA